jgi:hypothetical protein
MTWRAGAQIALVMTVATGLFSYAVFARFKRRWPSISQMINQDLRRVEERPNDRPRARLQRIGFFFLYALMFGGLAIVIGLGLPPDRLTVLAAAGFWAGLVTARHAYYYWIRTPVGRWLAGEREVKHDE